MLNTKSFYVIFITLFFYVINLNAKQTQTLPIYNTGESCGREVRIWFIDANNNNIYDILFYDGCNNKPIAFSLLINSFNEIIETQTAYLYQGTIEAKNFTILIYDPNSFTYTHKLYYDNQISKAVLEDYTDNDNEPTTYEEADNYFYIQLMGSTLLITKKADIDVQSILLCSLDGRIISNLQNVEGWSQFSFNLSLEPSGMYLLRFIARDRAMTKRMVYLR
ncbi:MAG: hypothetical protein EPN82_05950 [Bacteroidetes bacterium]|nr:MAG: hypothetical protein EPN82_05950 [Bacteroidota bacterium]